MFDSLFTEFLHIFGQIMLPLFVMALLFGLAGVSPDIVLKTFGSIVVSLISGVFNLLRVIIGAIAGAAAPKYKRAPGSGTTRKGPTRQL